MIIRILSTVVLLWGCQGELENQATVKTAPDASADASQETSTAGTISPEEANVVGDGVVNELDLAAVSNWLGSTAEDFPTTPICIKNPDVNKDGKINVGDMVLIARNKGKKVPVMVEPITTWEQADLNDDEVINILDLTIAASQTGDVAGWIKIGSVETIKAEGNPNGKYITVDEADANKDGIINYIDGLVRLSNLANIQKWFGKDKDGQVEVTTP